MGTALRAFAQPTFGSRHAAHDPEGGIRIASARGRRDAGDAHDRAIIAYGAQGNVSAKLPT